MSRHLRARKKKRLGSYPFASVTLSISLALFVIGLFGVMVIYAGRLEEVVRQQVRVQVYLKNGLSPVQIGQIEKNLSARDFVEKENPRPIEFISKEAAARQFVAETGEDFQAFLGENPLRDAFLVRIAAAYHSAKQFRKIREDIETIPGVFRVHYVETLLESINRNVSKIALLLMGLAAVLLVLVVLLINNTLRLALFSQRFIIRSMQLVGATRSFIRAPFLWRAAGYGLAAGIVAAGALLLLLHLANEHVPGLAALHDLPRLLAMLGALALLGIFVAVVSTARSVNQYLHQPLDDLY